MNLLRKLNEGRQRFIVRYSQYWLDELVERARKRHKDELTLSGTVLAILRCEELGAELVVPGLNIVTNAGDLYYAQRGALLTTGTPISPVPTNFTDTNGVPDMIMELYNGASAAPDKTNDRGDLVTLVTGSDQAMDAGYPKVNDNDTDNTGAAVDTVSYRVSYATGDANATGIADVILTNPTPGASEALLMHAEFGAPFDKTSSDTLKVFVNHNLLGV